MFRLALLAGVGFGLVFCRTGDIRAEDKPQFETDIQPILTAKCGKCHSTETKKGGLDASSMAGLKRGGESGESALADTRDDSMLWMMIDGGGMPPEDQPQLTKAELGTISNWIKAGSPAKTKAASHVTQHEVLPYLYARCVTCHGKRKQEGQLDLRSVESITKGGQSGPAVIPGKPEESLLLKRVHAREMPPPKELIRAGVRPLEVPEIERITQWIAEGAKKYEIAPDVQTTEPDSLVTDEDRQFWAFQPPRKPIVPSGASARNPIDAFLLRQLKERGLNYSEKASKLTLIRRVAFDLTGLPPEWEDVKPFLADESPEWYDRLVDFYLDSPHYGEHFGRKWLDLAGYADSEGKRSADPIRQHAWRYRDYVIRSLNNDKPYDQFLREQLAGDELYDFQNADSITPEMMDALVATGFLRMAPDGTGSDIVDTVEERFEVVADEMEVLGSAVLGLTLRCAQCHSHKYDPIPQRDYYRLVATFQGAYDVYDWLKPTSVAGQSKVKNPTRRYLPNVSQDIRKAWEAKRQAVQKEIDSAQSKLNRDMAESRKSYLNQELAKLPEPVRANVKSLLDTPANKRTDEQKELAKKYEKRLTISDAALLKKDAKLAKLKKQIDKEIAALKAKASNEPLIRALWDRGDPSPTWIFRRGQFSNPGELVGPGVLSVLTDGKTPFQPKPKRNGSTGRRLGFANWLTKPDHPLTARVMVNRVWHHHFGRGIVESLANFGKSGTPPTHPELLDWLAVSFVENGWSLKWLHRQILTSEAYRQSSQLTEDQERRDPDNRWLSRMPLRRRSAESVRDSLLAVAGELDETTFGEPITVNVRADGLITADRSDKGWRRSIYIRQRRKEIPTILEAFDLPQMNPNCIERPKSTVAPQALHLLNNGLVRELSLAFAKRIQTDVPVNRQKQIERIYQTALSRPPNEGEKQFALDTLDQLTKEWQNELKDQSKAETRALANYCHVLMNSAGFLFVD